MQQQQDEPVAGGSGVVPSRAERERNLEELVIERSKVEVSTLISKLSQSDLR